MKFARWILILVPLLLLAADEDAAKKKGGRLTVPEGAERIEPYTYRHKDSEGTVWIYKETPFGVVRYEEKDKPAAAPKATEADPLLKAFDEGEVVRFEKRTAFGKSTWRRKKTELTASERAAWEAAQKKQPSTTKSKQE